MNALIELFTVPGVASTVLYISLTAVAGMALGRLEIGKVKLGIAGVLFAGLVLAHFGARTEQHLLHFAREFGLILFVYSIGLNVGPRFFSSFKSDGLRLNLLAATIVILGFGIALAIHFIFKVPAAVITGIMCGAVTNTPSMGAAQQVLADQGGALAESAAQTGMGYAVAYPFGILGVIFAMLLIRAIFRIRVDEEGAAYVKQSEEGAHKLESIIARVTNPNLHGKTVKYLRKFTDKYLAPSRIERNNGFVAAGDDQVFQPGDVLYGVSSADHLDEIRLAIGEAEIMGKKEVDGELGMINVLVTKRKMAGKTIEQIGLSRRHGANITRIFRADMEFLPTAGSTVEFGDTIRIVGQKSILDDIRSEFGNSTKELSAPNTVPIFFGILLGIIIGSIPFTLPGLPVPARLGLAGGPLIAAILMGYKGRIGKIDFYMTPGANLMMREIGIVMFLSAVGLLSGGKIVSTLAEGGYVWLLYGMVITAVPVFLVAVVARLLKYNYLKICGLLAGAMTDPPALEYANSISPVHAQAATYAAVYPLTMFLRVLLAQVLVLVTLMGNAG